MSVVKRGDTEITDRYRPRKLGEIIGNESTIKAMKGILAEGNKRTKSMILFGNAGCVVGDTFVTVRKKSDKNAHKINIINPKPDNP